MAGYMNLDEYSSENIEHYIEGLKASVERAEEVRKLMSNRLFRKIIIEGFCLHDCARHLKESLDTRNNESARASFDAMARAAAYLEQYLEGIVMVGDNAANKISEAEATLDQVRAEELTE